MRIALVDDEITQLQHLQELLTAELDALMRHVPHSIDSYSSGRSFLDHWKSGSYDVIVLDIFMGGITGVDVAKEIRRTDLDVKLVFCSHSNEFAAESYQVNAQYYLVKPATRGSVSNMLKRLNLELIQLTQTVTLPDGHDVILRHIVFTEYYKHIVYVHLKRGEVYHLRTSHNIMEELLCPSGYIYSPNKGILLNFYEVSSMSDDSVLMSDGTVLPVSRRRSKELQAAYTKFRFRQMRAEVEVT